MFFNYELIENLIKTKYDMAPTQFNQKLISPLNFLNISVFQQYLPAVKMTPYLSFNLHKNFLIGRLQIYYKHP